MDIMRVGMLIYGLDRPLLGIGHYTVELVRALAALTPRPDLTLFTAGEAEPLAETGYARVPLPACRLLPGLLTWGQVVIARMARRLNIDILHDPTGVTPFLLNGRARAVVTVYDAFAWSLPGHSTTLDTLVYRYWLPHILPRVDAVITVSEASKSDIVRYLHVPEARVHVVPAGVHPRFRPVSADEVARVRQHYGLPEAYMLFVGSVEKRKNLSGLLHAYARLLDRGVSVYLVIVGARQWKYNGIMKTLQDLGLEREGQSRVIFTGYVPDADLPAIYSGATVFVFPSFYEGFGMPPLEAMACGAPVVCSNAASLPEVVGDAALTFDPRDTAGMADHIHRALTDDELRESLRARGLARARQFTWAKAAGRVREIYEL